MFPQLFSKLEGINLKILLSRIFLFYTLLEMLVNFIYFLHVAYGLCPPFLPSRIPNFVKIHSVGVTQVL